MHKVFYSWQSDTDRRINLDLLREALDTAIQRLDLDLELEESTRGRPGSKMIFETVREQIEAAAIFVPDLTFVGKSYDGAKLLPNSNVLVEYGYALAKVNDDRVVPVMNVHFGEPSRLPFDLAHRPVKILYDLAPTCADAELESTRTLLVDQLARELRGVFESGALFKGLSPQVVRIVKHLVLSSEVGWPAGETYDVAKLAAKLDMDGGATNKALKQLAALGYVKPLQIRGTDAPPVAPTDLLFWDFDHLFKGWNPRKDAKAVVEAMTSGGRRGGNCGRLAEELGWELRRINPALRYLASARLVLASEVTSYPLAVSSMRANDRTEGFLAGLLDPESSIRRGR